MRSPFESTLARNALILIGVLILIPIVAIGTLAVTSRNSDPPTAFFGGGPLIAGELIRGPEPDWSFLGDVGTIDLQLLDPPRSRVVWVADYNGRAYVVSGYMGNAIGRIWKQWPVQAEQDGRAVVRIMGKRHERKLVRIPPGTDVIQGVSAEFNRKYRFGGPDSIEAGTTWLFELAPRSSGSTGGSK